MIVNKILVPLNKSKKKKTIFIWYNFIYFQKTMNFFSVIKTKPGLKIQRIVKKIL